MRVARLRLPAVVEVMWTLALGREAAAARAAVYLHHTCLSMCSCCNNSSVLLGCSSHISKCTCSFLVCIYGHDEVCTPARLVGRCCGPLACMVQVGVSLTIQPISANRGANGRLMA